MSVIDLLAFSDYAIGDGGDVLAMQRAIEGFSVTVTLRDGGGASGEVDWVDQTGVWVGTALFVWADIARIEYA